MSSLIKSGEIVENKEGAYNTGGARMVNDESHQVVRFDNEAGEYRPSQTIYSYGVLNRYWQNEPNFSAAFVEAAIWLAKDWSKFCCEMPRVKLS